MHHHYEDIREQAEREPVWFDEHAVPRYCEFEPNEAANVYADEAVLFLIECQGCGAEFKVCQTSNKIAQYRSAFSRASYQAMKAERVLTDDDVAALIGECSLAAAVENDSLHFGDPPNVWCCPAGPTMNSVPVRVIEFWRKNDRRDWERVPELEQAIDPDWKTDAGGDDADVQALLADGPSGETD